MASPVEGVIKFDVEHEDRRLDPRVHGEAAALLSAWREVLARLSLVGRDPMRYQGAGYGNLSARLAPFGDVGRGRRRFIVTGSQTGGLAGLTLEHYCVVERYDVARNTVRSMGPIQPSSESLTHGAIYDIAPAARFVLHGHAPEIWRHARALGLPVTRREVANGTPEMALEVQRLYRESQLPATGILVMGGHEDGVLAFGATPDEAGQALVRQLARALAVEG
jgi:ribulose-5-phosphate 4-epimerase/fuculose-1-phosphate aldolase